MRPRRRALAAGTAVLLLCAQGGAEPSIWRRVSHPNARAEARLSRGMERMLDAEAQAQPDPEFARRFARAAVAMLDLARLPDPEDPRLRYVMARALISADVGRGAEAEKLLERAVDVLPEGALLARVYSELGRARALRGDSAGARDAQSRVLALEAEPAPRAVAYYERARALMRLGELDAAARDYESVGPLAPTELLRQLSRYGLALALERRGDLSGAYAVLDQVLFARLPLSRYPTDDPLELPGAIEPRYELEYVKALAAMARARRPDDPPTRRADYERAITHWEAYLDGAPPTEPWVPHARAHRARAAAELQKLPAAKPARPPRPARN